MTMEIQFFNKCKPEYDGEKMHYNSVERVITNIQLEEPSLTAKIKTPNNYDEDDPYFGLPLDIKYVCKYNDFMKQEDIKNFRSPYDKKLYIKKTIDGNVLYEGEIDENGYYNGIGKAKCPNSTYVGNFKHGNKDGKGIMFYNDNNVQYKGEFKENNKNGIGTYIFNYNNNILLLTCDYNKPFKDVCLSLTGDDNLIYDVSYFSNLGFSYRTHCPVLKINDTNINNIETFLNLKPNLALLNSTSTTCAFSNGVIYNGSIKEGKFDGKGTLTWPDGTRYVGTFKDGVCNKGKIIIIDTNKNIAHRESINFKIDQTNINKINSSDLKKFNIRYKETINCKDENKDIVEHSYRIINNDEKTKLSQLYLSKEKEYKNSIIDNEKFKTELKKTSYNSNYYESINCKNKNNISKTTYNFRYSELKK